jgi:hypothetical protein
LGVVLACNLEKAGPLFEIAKHSKSGGYMDDDKRTERAAAADKAAEAAYESGPSLTKWGMFYYGDAPAAIGGGVGAFIWFESERDLLDFIETHLPFSPPGPTSCDVEPVLSRVHEILDRLRNHKADRDTARLELNDALKRFSQINWWGLGAELFSGISPFPIEVRLWFRETKQDPDLSDRPISEDEKHAFLESLTEYGL